MAIGGCGPGIAGIVIGTPVAGLGSGLPDGPDGRRFRRGLGPAGPGRPGPA